MEPAQKAADFDSPRDPPQPHPIDARPTDARRARFKRSKQNLPQVEDLSQKETLKKKAINNPNAFASIAPRFAFEPIGGFGLPNARVCVDGDDGHGDQNPRLKAMR